VVVLREVVERALAVAVEAGVLETQVVDQAVAVAGVVDQAVGVAAAVDQAVAVAAAVDQAVAVAAAVDQAGAAGTKCPPLTLAGFCFSWSRSSWQSDVLLGSSNS
jgi:hypothetical protein